MPDKISQLKQWIHQCSRIAVLTGAGISTESGITDYRSQGGLWSRFQPVTIQEFLADEEKRELYWIRKKEMFAQIRDARPNQGHQALARLETQGKLLGIITQNIDGLHRLAGNQKVLEIHGTNREVICLSCHHSDAFETVYGRLERGEKAPLCQICGGFLKPRTISFGQALEPLVWEQALDWARRCDLMLVLGSTLIVEPAASIPRIAKNQGAPLVIINRDPTPLDKLADMVFDNPIGSLLASVVS